MNEHLVLTLSGHDRVGMVEKISKLVLNHKGNVEESRMARLGGEFAMLMLISVNESSSSILKESLQDLQKEGFKVTIDQTKPALSEEHSGWIPFKIKVNGADHEGIVHRVTQYLAEKEITIESMETHIKQAPMSGAPLFIMEGIVLAAPDQKSTWKNELIQTGDELGVDIDISAYAG
jgi:glycine cleavage system transcriptional repressor